MAGICRHVVKKNIDHSKEPLSLGRHLVDLDRSGISNFDQMMNVPCNFYLFAQDTSLMLCNERQAMDVEYVSPKHAAGKTLEDFFKFAEAQKLAQNNAQVMRSAKPEFFIEELLLQNKDCSNSYFSLKSPLFDMDGQIIGISGIGLQLSNKKLMDVMEILANTFMPFQNSSADQLRRMLCISEIEGILLSPQETRVVYYLTRGCTVKYIARLLAISPKTVEFHITNIKSRLNCYSKMDLIVKALSSGFPYTHHFPIFEKLN